MNTEAAIPNLIRPSRPTASRLARTGFLRTGRIVRPNQTGLSALPRFQRRDEEPVKLTRLVKPETRAEFIMFAMNSF
jgi:hypothetical protein